MPEFRFETFLAKVQQSQMKERQESAAREKDRKDYLSAIRVSGEDMIHVERLMQGTSQKDELLRVLEGDSAVFSPPLRNQGAARLQQKQQSKAADGDGAVCFF